MLSLAASPRSFPRHVKTRWSYRSTLRGRRDRVPCVFKSAASQLHCFIANSLSTSLLSATITQQPFDMTGILVPEGVGRRILHMRSCFFRAVSPRLTAAGARIVNLRGASARVHPT